MRSSKTAARRRYMMSDAPPDLAGSGVPEELWPTKAQYELWWSFIRQPVTVEDDVWLAGNCPNHDPDGESPTPTAAFKFSSGAFRCNVEDDKPCHPDKSARTLNSMTSPRRLAGVDWDSIEDDPEDVARAEAMRAEMEAAWASLGRGKKRANG